MDELIIRSLQGKTTPREEAELHAWRRATLVNERWYRSVEAVWQLTAAAPAGLERGRPSAGDIVSLTRSKPRRDARPAHAWLRGAAAIAAAILLGFFMGGLHPESSGSPQVETTEFITGPGEMVTVRLEDGSIVRLAERSRLAVSDHAGARDAWLDGKAFFAVAKDSKRPFTVRTRAGQARVLGTRFEIEVGEGDDLRVAVVGGKVEVDAGGEKKQVGPGEVSHSERGGVPTVTRNSDIGPLLQWMGPFLAFESTPLREVARELEHRYEIRVEIADSALAARTVTAWFGDQSVGEVLAVVCRVVDVYCSIGDGVVSIEP